MGGGEHTQRGRRGRRALRRAVLPVLPVLPVLLVLMGVLAGALFLCARPGEAHDSAPVPWQAARAAPGAQAVPGAEAVPGAQAAPGAQAVCVSPYDVPGCSPLTHVTPALLPVPAPAVARAGGGAPPAAVAAGPVGRIREPAPLARAPDPYALRVLRT
ncbi:hypothetical protein [Streptomyces sp. NPDC002990]